MRLSLDDTKGLDLHVYTVSFMVMNPGTSPSRNFWRFSVQRGGFPHFVTFIEGYRLIQA
jgi:hypothetical protein